ncbi:LPXTG cell wall anchor domain-containing protein [Companilactobacillus keshanensis]|uniref:LPXTG cell wall anchor domain-containing protein n=1 Tax=Companilactobacillus keshanensis TaxID=2486003 RepID=A0ABW4BSG1_9LACO|nr:LPXTG cell wall anchor domain-containing protein [Companilactobacillus keshanensis]
MSETGKLGKSMAGVAAGATLLPQTGEKIFNFLPILGAIMLVILLGFTIYNKFLKSWYGVK